jgi:hypothetical protein
MTGPKLSWRPHFYEVAAVVNILIIHLMLMRDAWAVIETLPAVLVSVGPTFIIQLVAGVIVRLAICAWRGNWRAYLAEIRRPAWIVESIRIVIFGTLVVHAYGWIKIAVPLRHPRLFDQELWNLDQTLFFGLSPNILALNLFGNRTVLHVVDYWYGNLFIVSMFVAFGYFLSAPSNRLRIAFVTGNAVMWLTGSWLYMALPSIGPAYRFPEIWLRYVDDFRKTQFLQALLWGNYQRVLLLPTSVNPGPINVMLGIAAFPSLHVAMQTYVFLWFRKLWTWGEIMFGFFVFFILLGSLITGWHYLIDGIAGILLAYISYAIAMRAFRVHRWLKLRAAQ